MFEYIVFGIVDNAVMILGAMTGYEVEKFLPKQFQKGLGVVFGAGIGNAVSDFMGGAGTGSWDLAFGTALGCIIGLIFIPLFVMIGKLRDKRRVK
jgi:L-aminopeptidase/D-esterase-like protein